MADYDIDIWGRWQASDHPEFYNFLRSILRPKYLLYFDGGSPENIGTRQAAFLSQLRNDILNSDLSSTGILKSVAKPAPNMNFAETVAMLDSFRMKDVTAFARSELIGDELMKNARAYLDDKYVAYLDGGGTMGLSETERERLDNFIANPNDPRNVLSLSGMGDKTESKTVQNGFWNMFTSKWDSQIGAPQGIIITPQVSTPATTTQPATTTTTTPTQPDATYVAPEDTKQGYARSFLTPSELTKLEKVLSSVAFEYLTTGRYPRIAKVGEPFLSAADRQKLDKFAADPTSVDMHSLDKFFSENFPGPRNVNENQVFRQVEDIVENRQDLAEQSAESMEAARQPISTRQPSVPLPSGQVYSWDSTRKLWKVVGSPGSGKPQQLIRYVNQLGETVDSNGNLIEQGGPGAGFGPERGESSPLRTASPSTAATPATTTTAATPATTTASTTQPTVTPTQRPSYPTTIDEGALAGAEFGVGGAASGRGYMGTVQGGYGRAAAADADDAAAAQNAADVAAATAASGGAVGGAVGGQTTTADTEIPVDWETAAAEMYPEYYAIVKSVPEIAALLKKSIGPPAWSDEKLEAELRKTNWWKTTVASARDWDLKSGLDPATYQGFVDEQAAVISQQALGFGIRLSDERLQKLALDSLRLDWGEQTITNAIGMAASEGGTAGATQLREGYYGQSVREISQQYGVSLADQTFNQFVEKIAVGEETLGSFQDYALSIAKSLYPSLTEQFDAGRTFDQATSNYKEIAANILERDTNSINMTDPTWVQAVTYQPDPKTGEQRMMNMAEWGDYLRKNEALGYQYTTEARSRAYEVADKLANMFGRV